MKPIKKGLKTRTKSRIPLEENVAELFKQQLQWIQANYGVMEGHREHPDDYGPMPAVVTDIHKRILFVTLTRVKKCFSRDELAKAGNAYFTNVVRKYIQYGVCVVETHKDGSFHLHLIILLPWDYTLHPDWRQDVARNSEARKHGKDPFYARFDPKLRWFWNEMRERGLAYGFGRFEALPPKKDGKALSFYISKYLSKALDSRAEAVESGRTDLKGMRMVRYVNALYSRKLTPDGAKIRPARFFRCPPGVGSKPKRRGVIIGAKGKRRMLSHNVIYDFCGGWRVASTLYGGKRGGYKWRRVLTLTDQIMRDNKFEHQLEDILPILGCSNRKTRKMMLDQYNDFKSGLIVYGVEPDFVVERPEENTVWNAKAKCFDEIQGPYGYKISCVRELIEWHRQLENPKWGYNLSSMIYHEYEDADGTTYQESIYDCAKKIVALYCGTFGVRQVVLINELFIRSEPEEFADGVRPSDFYIFPTDENGKQIPEIIEPVAKLRMWVS